MVVLSETSFLWLEAVIYLCLMEQKSGFEKNSLTKYFTEMGKNVKPFRLGFFSVFHYSHHLNILGAKVEYEAVLCLCFFL